MSNKNIMNRMKNEYPFEKKAGWLAAYLLCGGLAALSLLTAPMGHHEVLHMIVTTLGILGMALINTILGMKRAQRKYLVLAGFRRDVGIFMIWIFLLLVWYSDIINR